MAIHLAETGASLVRFAAFVALELPQVSSSSRTLQVFLQHEGSQGKECYCGSLSYTSTGATLHPKQDRRCDKHVHPH